MADKKSIGRNIIFYITLGTTVILLVAGFLLPPMGVIDSSVIQAAGILGAFGVIGQLPTIIESAKSVRLSSGNHSIEVTARDSEKEAPEA